jgi:two-component system heavy metal sensor histidine kinase CusS
MKPASRLDVVGDATVAVDEPLVKRALSNLLGNATRFAAPGSTVQVRIGDTTPQAPSEVEVVVQQPRPRHRAGSCCPACSTASSAPTSRAAARDREQHHGLGLAIVAAIARMHAGRTLARSHDGITEVGFTVAA